MLPFHLGKPGTASRFVARFRADSPSNPGKPYRPEPGMNRRLLNKFFHQHTCPSGGVSALGGAVGDGETAAGRVAGCRILADLGPFAAFGALPLPKLDRGAIACHASPKVLGVHPRPDVQEADHRNHVGVEGEPPRGLADLVALALRRLAQPRR